MAIKDVARAFAQGIQGTTSCHNAVATGREYYLHGNLIALRAWSSDKGSYVVFNWHGWYGPTTANHMNHILKALGVDKRVSYAHDRDNGVDIFEVWL